MHAPPHGGLAHGHRLTHHDRLAAPRVHHEAGRGRTLLVLLLKRAHPKRTLLRRRLLVETPGAVAPHQWGAVRILLPVEVCARRLGLGSQELVCNVVSRPLTELDGKLAHWVVHQYMMRKYPSN